jgi:hypothetical protein
MMRNLIDRRAVDDAADAYADWRTACAAVEDTYARWQRAGGAAASAAYFDYAVALEIEEQLADVYAGYVLAARPPLRLAA